MVSGKSSQNLIVGVPVFVFVWIAGGELITIIMSRYGELLSDGASLTSTVLGVVLIYVIVTKYSGLLRIIVLWGTAALVMRWMLTIILTAVGVETGGVFI